jgi:hypothetical protein
MALNLDVDLLRGLSLLINFRRHEFLSVSINIMNTPENHEVL